jgi:hypothetical protein
LEKCFWFIKWKPKALIKPNFFFFFFFFWGPPPFSLQLELDIYIPQSLILASSSS